MTAVEALRAARAAGVEIALNGDDLVLEASSPPPDSVLDALSHNKDGIVALLRPGDDGWLAEDWQVYFDERAGIVEFDGGLPRPEAEAQAFACCVSEWLKRHPQASSPDRCLACRGGDSANDPLFPFGTDTHGHAWLHSHCWQDWHEARKAEAVVSLLNMGIEKPANFPNDFRKKGST
jgi:hypothetical protein